MEKPKTFKTPKGTELPLLNLRGKDYLQVAHRLVWFREERPNWAIQTEIVNFTSDLEKIAGQQAIFRATILNETGIVIAQGTKRETFKDFPDFIEKAETGAIGRALALCGYGTQFAPELEEGDRLADSPTQPAKKTPAKPAKKLVKTEFSATVEQLKELSGVVKEKLGAEEDKDIIPALNKKFPFQLTSSKEITRVMAKQMIGSLKAIVTDNSEVQVQKETN